MPRLDVARVTLWRSLQTMVAELERAIDADLRSEWDIGLAWFDVLAALQRCGGLARPSELAVDLGAVASSLSRRLDRLEEEGWAKRHAATASDQRTVLVELTKRGRNLWRAMNQTYRRSLQLHFAGDLTDDDVDRGTALLDVILTRFVGEVPDTGAP